MINDARLWTERAKSSQHWIYMPLKTFAPIPMVVVLLTYFWGRVSCWPGTGHVDQAAFGLTETLLPLLLNAGIKSLGPHAVPSFIGFADYYYYMPVCLWAWVHVCPSLCGGQRQLWGVDILHWVWDLEIELRDLFSAASVSTNWALLPMGIPSFIYSFCKFSFFFFWDGVFILQSRLIWTSSCSLGWTRIYRDIFASASWALGKHVPLSWSPEQ